MSSGRLFPAGGWWIDEGEEQEVEFITFVPSRYDLLSMRCDIRLAKEVAEELQVKWVVDPSGFVELALAVDVDGDRETWEEYNFRKHRDLLGNGNPYRSYSMSWLVPEEVKTAQSDSGSGAGNAHNPASIERPTH